MARRPASRQRTPVAERGDIYLVTLDPTEGHEQRGRGLCLSYRRAFSIS